MHRSDLMVRPAESKPEPPLRLTVLWCVPGGMLAYIFALTLVSSVVPRHSEGVRDVVAIPWPIFATIPWLTAAVLGTGLVVILLRGARTRLVAFLLLVITIAVCNSLAVGLLRRDYIGKF